MNARTDPVSARARRVTFRGLIGVAIGLIGLATLAIGVTIWSLRDDAILDAASDSNSFAAVLAEQTARSVQSIDLVLIDTVERLRGNEGGTAEEFDRLVQTEATHQFLKERLARLSQAEVVAVINKDGQIINSTRAWPSPKADVHDRDYFQHFRNTADKNIYVSNVVPNRVNGTRTVFLSKRIDDRHGDFLGVALVGLNINYFERIFESITSLNNQSFLLLRTDGTALLRYPDSNDRANMAIPAGSPWHEIVAGGRGSYRSKNFADGEPRIVAVQRLRDYPLVLNVAYSEYATLATWRRRAAFIGIGTLLAVLCSAFLLRALAKQFRGSLVSEMSLAEKSRELQQANERMDAALSNMSQGLGMFDSEGRLLVRNERYLQMYGLSPDVVKPGCALRDLLGYRKAAGNFAGNIDQYIADLLVKLSQGKHTYFTTHLGDGRVVAVHNQPMAGGGWVATHDDITERQLAEARVAHMARHDALTDLANRVLFREKMDEALARLRRHGNKFSLFVFDLDMFKAVNDTLGHPVGDALLKAAAQRLRGLVRETDTVGRLGGDEFAIIQINEDDQKAAAIGLATRLLETLSAPYEIDGHEIVIGISVGIALAPHDGADADALLKNADLALYRAKTEGRKDFRFFEADMDAKVRLRRALEIDLRNAMARNEFEIYYQSIVDVATQTPCGAEALIRWNHPQRGLIAPDAFIPVAEEIGLIIPLGEWILRKACADASHWPAQIKLSVNLSPVQFRNGNLVEVVTAALAASGLAPQRLELEITESVLLQKDAGNVAVLLRLKSLGIGIVLDDFGTGYSSLSYLRMFPFDKIKIDQSFVQEMPNREDCAAIVCAIIDLGRSLDIATTAEGVETEEQFSLLRAAGCTQAQGFLFSRPRPAGELDFKRAAEKERAA